MATITEDYVSFETAKLLKEKGFPLASINFKDWVFCMYDKNGGIHWGCYHQDYYARVTLQMIMKWLREIHNLFIEIQCYGCGADKEAHFEYSYIISEYVKINNDICIIFGLEKRNAKSRFPSYEEAVETAIKYCLENLI